MMTHTYTITGSLPGFNEAINDARTNKFTSAKQKRSYTAFCANEAKRQKIPPISVPFIVSVLWVEKDRRRDPDNIACGLKYLLDGLQEANIIANDGWHEVVGITHRFATDANKPRIVVELQEVYSDEN